MIRTCPSCGAANRVPGARLADAGRCGACKVPLPPPSEPIDAAPATFEDIVGAARVPDRARCGRSPPCPDTGASGRQRGTNRVVNASGGMRSRKPLPITSFAIRPKADRESMNFSSQRRM